MKHNNVSEIKRIYLSYTVFICCKDHTHISGKTNVSFMHVILTTKKMSAHKCLY